MAANLVSLAGFCMIAGDHFAAPKGPFPERAAAQGGICCGLYGHRYAGKAFSNGFFMHTRGMILP
jgi:hypothetical protein